MRDGSPARIAVFLFLATCLAAPARAYCPGSGPNYAAFVNQDPEFLESCPILGANGLCFQPSAPMVESGSVLAQEVVLSATVNTTWSATSVWWMAEHKSVGGAWTELWRHESREGAPHAPNSTVRFGGPGLEEQGEHRFRVAYCQASGCNLLVLFQ